MKARPVFNAAVIILAMCTALASLLLMGAVFVEEGFYNHSVTVYEPNVFVAQSEFVLVIAGFIANLWLFLRRASK